LTSGLRARIVQILRLAAAPPWAASAIILLGLAGAALEGAGLYLFMPLVGTLSGGAVSGGIANHLVYRVLAPAPHRLWTALLVAGLCLSIAARNGVGFVGGYIARWVDGVVAHRLRVKVLEQTLGSCIDYRTDSRITDVVTTLANNTWKVSHALSLVWRLAICSCAFAVFFTLLMVLSLRLTAVAAVMLALTAAVAHLASARAEAAGQDVVEENKRFGLRMWESAGALQLIRTFAREDHEIARFREVSDRMRRRILGLDLLWSFPGPIAEVAGAVLIGILILLGSRLGVGLASLAAFLAVLYRLQGPVRECLSCKVAIDGLAAAVFDVESFLAKTGEPFLRSGDVPAPSIRRGVTFCDVSFRYAPDEALALDGVTLDFPAGKTTAIVGRSGAGKSTIMSLLFRFRDPASGTVLVDGARLTELDLKSWRSRLSLMPQEAQLFNTSVAENIGYGDLTADAERIRRAAEVAGAAPFIAQLPQGYDTELGDRGVRLSGGQRQRIALARTILKDPELLLLDEPTNALDVETERAFQAALRQFSAGRTVVVIAHRLSTVQTADQVIVLEGGRVAEVGAPQDLIARPGRFAQLHGLAVADNREAA
jgi:subfamily B ATP-binding cassette protein MsbA